MFEKSVTDIEPLLNFFFCWKLKWIENLKDKEDQMLSHRRNLLIAITFFSQRKCHISLMKLGWWVYQSSLCKLKIHRRYEKNERKYHWKLLRESSTLANNGKCMKIEVKQNCSILVDSNDWKWIFRIATDWLDFISDHQHQLHLHFICIHATSTTRHSVLNINGEFTLVVIGRHIQQTPNSTQRTCTLQLMWFITIALSVNCSHHHLPNFFADCMHRGDHVCDVAMFGFVFKTVFNLTNYWRS